MKKPLVIDLDGTLIRSDLLVESAFNFLTLFPFRFYRLFVWLLRHGKAGLKARLAAATQVDVTVLPYNREVMSWLLEERAAGRTLVLATASHQSYADAIASHLHLFDRAIGSDDKTNLSAERKRQRLVAEYGEKGFDYAGNSKDDLAVWQSAANAHVVNASHRVTAAAQRIGNVDKVIATRSPALKTWTKALRLHQWLKNLLIFVPLFASHSVANPVLAAQACIAFLAFGMCASSVYLLNDALDLEDDRHHPVKRNRPMASGSLPLVWGLAALPVLLIGSFAIASVFLPWHFDAVLLGYYVLTLAYSLYLKRKVMVDVVVLAILYTVRIIAGTAAVDGELTFWLLAFSMFIFLSLALIKRYAELAALQSRGLVKTRGRGYEASDLPLVSSLGAASGYLSVLVLALYIQDVRTTTLYHHPQIIWLACPLLLFWVSRAWMIAHRGLMHDDPIVFAARDRVSIVIALLCALIFWLAL